MTGENQCVFSFQKNNNYSHKTEEALLDNHMSWSKKKVRKSYNSNFITFHPILLPFP